MLATLVEAAPEPFRRPRRPEEPAALCVFDAGGPGSSKMLSFSGSGEIIALQCRFCSYGPGWRMEKNPLFTKENAKMDPVGIPVRSKRLRCLVHQIQAQVINF